MNSFLRPLKKLLPNGFKHRLKKLFGRIPTPSPPPQELCDAYEKATMPTWAIASVEPTPIPGTPETTSRTARRDFFDRSFFAYWYARVQRYWERYQHEIGSDIFYHRKLWEFVYIIQALYERGCLVNGKRGLGFAVGQEPLPALFASLGCEILASDQDSAAMAIDWTNSNQHAGADLALLNRDGICPAEAFARQVSFRNVDMNAIPDDLSDFDFCWSSCAFEHLGSIRAGLDFVVDAMKVLKPGGVAVHTTELNLTSDDETADNRPDYVLFRKQDMCRLADRLTEQGHFVWPFDFTSGESDVDRFVDLPPFFRKKMHLNLYLDGFTTTSIGLIVQKGGKEIS